MNDERTDFEIALDDLLQVARHAPRTGEGYQEIQAARRAFLAAFPPPAPDGVRLTLSREQAEGVSRDLHYWIGHWGGLSFESIEALSVVDAALASDPAPEPSEQEIEAGARALLLNWQGADTEDLLNDPEWRGTYLQGAKAVLAAARTARQTGGKS